MGFYNQFQFFCEDLLMMTTVQRTNHIKNNIKRPLTPNSMPPTSDTTRKTYSLGPQQQTQKGLRCILVLGPVAGNTCSHRSMARTGGGGEGMSAMGGETRWTPRWVQPAEGGGLPASNNTYFLLAPLHLPTPHPAPHLSRLRSIARSTPRSTPRSKPLVPHSSLTINGGHMPLPAHPPPPPRCCEPNDA